MPKYQYVRNYVELSQYGGKPKIGIWYAEREGTETYIELDHERSARFHEWVIGLCNEQLAAKKWEDKLPVASGTLLPPPPSADSADAKDADFEEGISH